MNKYLTSCLQCSLPQVLRGWLILNSLGFVQKSYHLRETFPDPLSTPARVLCHYRALLCFLIALCSVRNYLHKLQ